MTLRAMRQALKMSQEQIAAELSIDRSTVAKWETGAALPRAEMLLKIARLYDCTIEELLEGEKAT